MVSSTDSGMCVIGRVVAAATGADPQVVAEMEKFKLQSIARHYGIQMQQRSLPSDEEVEKVVAERVTALLEANLRSRDNLQLERMRRFTPLAKNLAQSDAGLALMIMLIDDHYQQTLHAPPEQPAPEPETERLPKPEPERSPKPQPAKKRSRSRTRSTKPKGNPA